MLDQAHPYLSQVESLMEALVAADQSDTVGQIVLEHLRTGGKRLRAKLALAAYQGMGGEDDASVGWAAACEILHNATLVHDDLQDGDRMRRGHPTVWVAHGDAHAINAGDLLFVLPYLALDRIEVSPEKRALLTRALASYSAEVVRGQGAELSMTARARGTLADYENVIRAKTSALFELPVVGAAILRGDSYEQALERAKPFAPLGSVFQMQDDVLDLYGDKGRESPGSDLREGKVSALVVSHLEANNEDLVWLETVLRTERDKTAQADIERATQVFIEGGALERVLKRMKVLSDEALGEAKTNQPDLYALVDTLLQKINEPIQEVWDQFFPQALEAKARALA